ncbi:MAG: DUF86 domain-containing protein [Bacteroidia bacterium]
MEKPPKEWGEDIKQKYPLVEWKNMSRMRDRLIHHYFGVDYDIVFNTITTDIPVLCDDLKRIIALESPR